MRLHFLDYFCILGYLAFIIVLGSCFAGQQKTTKNYFLAGKSMRWLPLAISMYATLFSSISYVMAPAEVFRRDLQYLVALAMFPLASVAAIVLFIDFYVRLRITTVYEYIEARFSRSLSWLVLSVYMLYRCLYAGIVVFALSMVLHVTMGFPLRFTMVGVGLGAIIYTTLGGITAVIWTDVAQFFVLFGGLVVALWFAVSKVPGGLPAIWRISGEAGKLRVINTDLDLTARYVFWTLIPYGFIDFLGSKAVDQMNVQRYLSARSPRSAKLAMLVQSFFTMPVWLLLFGVGMSLYAYYDLYPSPEVSQFVADGKYDRIFPHYIASVMPVGVRGLMIAALLAAAMSTMDSVLNVLSTISVVNIYREVINERASDAECLVVAKLTTVLWGIVVIALALSMINIESILRTVNSIAGILVGPVVGVFVLGMFSRRTNWQGVMIGLLLAFPPVLCLERYTEITFTLYGAIGVAISIAAGYGASLAFPCPPPQKTEGLIWRWRGLREMLF